MTRKELLQAIKDLEKRFSDLFIKANGTDIWPRIGLHIAEARMLLKIQDHVDIEGIEKVYNSLVENYEEVLWINDRRNYF